MEASTTLSDKLAGALTRKGVDGSTGAVADTGGDTLRPIMMEAAPQVRRPTEQATAEQAAEAGAVASG